MTSRTLLSIFCQISGHLVYSVILLLAGAEEDMKRWQFRSTF